MTIRHVRGYTLIMVLGVLLVLSFLLAAVLTSSGEQQVAGVTVMTQRLSANRADETAQQAIALIKAGGIDPAGMIDCSFPAQTAGLPYLLPPPAFGTGTLCSSAQYISGNLKQNDGGIQFATGNGIISQYWIYKRLMPSLVLGNSRMLTVYAEGYYGASLQSGNLAVSSVVAEVIVPEPPSAVLTPEGDYGVFR